MRASPFVAAFSSSADDAMGAGVGADCWSQAQAHTWGLLWTYRRLLVVMCSRAPAAPCSAVRRCLPVSASLQNAQCAAAGW